MNSTAVRLVTRCSSNDGTETDMLIGTMLKGQSALKPNMVYEIQEDVLGTLTVVEIGPSVMARNKGLFCWAYTIGDILSLVGRHLFYTEKEYANEDNLSKEEEE